MADSQEQRARRAVRTAQAQYERERDKARKTRRQAFIAAQDSGLSLRQIAEEVGLHHSSVADIIDGK